MIGTVAITPATDQPEHGDGGNNGARCVGGLLQAAAALHIVRAHLVGLFAQWRIIAVAAVKW